MPSIAELEWQCRQAQLCSETTHPPVRQFGTHRFILHAFSGRRRAGDFQFFIDSMAAAHPGIVLHTPSVDIILDTQWGDVQFWKSAARRGWVVGFLGSPPCETHGAEPESIAYQVLSPIAPRSEDHRTAMGVG